MAREWQCEPIVARAVNLAWDELQLIVGAAHRPVGSPIRAHRTPAANAHLARGTGTCLHRSGRRSPGAAGHDHPARLPSGDHVPAALVSRGARLQRHRALSAGMEPDREDERTDVHLTRGLPRARAGLLAGGRGRGVRAVPRVAPRRLHRAGEGTRAVHGRGNRRRRPARAAMVRVVLQASETRSLVESLVPWLNQQAVDPEYAVIGHAGGVERRRRGVRVAGRPGVGEDHADGWVGTGWVRRTSPTRRSRSTGRPVRSSRTPSRCRSIRARSTCSPSWRRHLPPGFDGEIDGQWQVPPSSIRADAVGGRCRAKYLVFPQYEADVVTRIEPIARAEALVELAKNTFRFREHPRRSLDSLARRHRRGRVLPHVGRRPRYRVHPHRRTHECVRWLSATLERSMLTSRPSRLVGVLGRDRR